MIRCGMVWMIRVVLRVEGVVLRVDWEIQQDQGFVMKHSVSNYIAST